MNKFCRKSNARFQSVMDLNSDCRMRKGVVYLVKGIMEKGYPQTKKHRQGSPVVCNVCLSKNKMQANLWSCSQLQGKRKLKRLMKEFKKRKFPQLYCLLKTQKLLIGLCFLPTPQPYPALHSLCI